MMVELHRVVAQGKLIRVHKYNMIKFRYDASAVTTCLLVNDAGTLRAYRDYLLHFEACLFDASVVICYCNLPLSFATAVNFTSCWMLDL